MPWQRTGDNAATYPQLMQVAGLRGAEECSVNEVAGFVWRCSAQSAGWMTDYNIDIGTVMMLSPTRWRQVTRLAVRAHLLTEHRVDGLRVWRLVEDPEFIHIRMRADVEWDRQRGRDRKNPELTNVVLERDGDACRYCDVVVNWADRKGGRGGTFDHREPGQPATVATYVVSCRGCNSRRSNDPDAEQLHPLLPPPLHPFYTAKTAERLTVFFGRPFLASPARPGTQPDTAHSDSAPSRFPHFDTPARPGTQPDTAHTAPPDWAADQVIIPDIRGGTRVGTGIGSGSGLVVPGLDGSGADPPPGTAVPSSGRRRRPRRGGRRR